MNSIKPTVGRKVYFWLGKEPMTYRVGNCLDMHQPFDATITYVHPGGARVNLAVLDHVGTHFTTHRVLLQDPSEGGDVHGGNNEAEGLATWMPYQVGQARAQALGAAGPVTTGMPVRVVDETFAPGTMHGSGGIAGGGTVGQPGGLDLSSDKPLAGGSCSTDGPCDSCQ